MLRTIRFLSLFTAICTLPVIMAPSAFSFEPAKLPDLGNPEWIAQCGQNGGYEACENLADQHFKGLNGVPKSELYTGYYLLKACRYGNFEMCEYATGMVLDENNQALEDSRSLQIYKEAMSIRCLHDDPLMCIGVAATFSDEDKPSYDPDFVGNSYVIGCERGLASACFWQGLWFNPLYKKTNVTPNVGHSLTGYRRTCMSEVGDDQFLDASDVTFGCYMSYHYLKGGEGVPAEPDQAEHALYRSCDYGDADNCELAASSFYHGVNSVQKNPVSARAMATRGCELGNMGACAIEGSLAYADEDYSKSFVAYQKACDANATNDNCSMAAATAYFAFGQNDSNTTTYSKAACDVGDGWSCFTYATNTFWLDGDNFNRDVFAKACTLGFQDGCSEVEKLDAQAARNAAIDRSNEQMLADLQKPIAPVQRVPTLGEQIQALGNSFQDWKPSYCSNSSITSRDGTRTNRAECADY